MSNTSHIARRSFLAIQPDGQSIRVTVQIGLPYEVASEEWAVPVSMEGLHDRLGDLHGLDSWQVVQLAFEFIVQLLEHFVRGGGSLCWLDTHDRFDPADLLPGQGDRAG
ncbi:hypothetical protein [Ideonella sp.]|uniref:DUF6968 family protein n=1 Tax=Ideonella sp. TaxID=1929293 RepID=UPI0035B390D7